MMLRVCFLRVFFFLKVWSMMFLRRLFSDMLRYLVRFLRILSMECLRCILVWICCILCGFGDFGIRWFFVLLGVCDGLGWWIWFWFYCWLSILGCSVWLVFCWYVLVGFGFLWWSYFRICLCVVGRWWVVGKWLLRFCGICFVFCDVW